MFDDYDDEREFLIAERMRETGMTRDQVLDEALDATERRASERDDSTTVTS